MLWLVGASPHELKQLPNVMQRVRAVDRFRKASKAGSTRAYPYPTLFRQVTQPRGDYILIPGHSSENRAYIPLGYLSRNVIVGNSCFSLQNATLFHFGVIQFTMHMAWVRYTCGRLESRYRYSKDIVYNNFPWPDVPQRAIANQPPGAGDKARIAVETAAQSVLDARAQFQSGASPATLADLYDPLSMPPELHKAHKKLDAAVDRAYEGSGGKRIYKNDAERVAFLFDLYQRLTSLLPVGEVKASRRVKIQAA